ncbi:MAG TPA: hypothetical protein VEH77_00245, partial [Roseiarcus sp.]|nr:hypothetical protein [Roseiarcus sp.]
VILQGVAGKGEIRRRRPDKRAPRAGVVVFTCAKRRWEFGVERDASSKPSSNVDMRLHGLSRITAFLRNFTQI